MNVDDYFQNSKSPLKEVACKLRGIFQESSSNFREEIKWNVPTYSLNQNICSIMAHKNHVNISNIQRSAYSIFKRFGRCWKRYEAFKIFKTEELNCAKIKGYIQQAIDLDL